MTRQLTKRRGTEQARGHRPRVPRRPVQPRPDGGRGHGQAQPRRAVAVAVAGWLDGYPGRLDDPPAPSDRITDQTWRQALGSINRVADWELYFRAQLAGEAWRDVLARWWPRLVPGLAAAATHGVIRTSHAARSLAARYAVYAGGGSLDPLLRHAAARSAELLG